MATSSTKTRKTILITSGRAPAALELARIFHRAGHRVIMAESLRRHLSISSQAVAKNYHVVWPTEKPEQYVAEIGSIIETEDVDILLPTCEEIYFLSQRRDQLPERCTWLVPEWEQLHSLHSKWEFVNVVRQWNLSAPETRLLTDRSELETCFEEGQLQVFKPVYSRFANDVVVQPENLDALSDVTPSIETPWVAQQFIEGQQFSTFSLACDGELLAHVTYPMNFTTGNGPTYAFEAIQQPDILDWVRNFIDAENFTGQIAFDFIQQTDGTVVAIECNPRATSGLHLFRGRLDLADAYVEPEKFTGDFLVPDGRPAYHGLPLALLGLLLVRSWKELKRWTSMLFYGRDMLLSWSDLMPLLMLSINLYPIFKRAREHSVGLGQASTMDIEWNGPATMHQNSDFPNPVEAPTIAD